MTRKIASAALLCCLMTGAAFVHHAGFNAAYAEEAWKTEFEDICGKTEFAMEFSKEELQNLIARCDKLKPLIQKLDESAAKVYLKRLQLCRDLYAYVLESKSQ